MNRTARRLLALLTFALLLGLAARCLVIVDETEAVVVTEFGRVVAILGDEPGESGLHLRWPWRSWQAIDRRLRVSEPPPREVITSDKRSLEVATFLAWRVADPLRFLQGAGSVESAEARLDERVASALNDLMGGLSLDNLATTDAERWRLDSLADDLLGRVGPRALEELGVEVVDARLRRFNHPLEVRPAVFDLIRSERQQEAARFRAEGEAEHRKITSAADRERDEVLARAAAEAERIRAAGQAEATRTLNAAHSRDPSFAEFLRTLDAYRALLDEKSTIVLSTSSPLLRLLGQGPGEELLAPPATAEPGSPAAASRPSPPATALGSPEDRP